MTLRSKMSINVLLFILLALLAVSQVILLNKYSTSGDMQVSLVEEIKKVSGENNSYSQKIASFSAVATISLKAQDRGLSKQISSLSLSVPIPVAYNLIPSL